MEDDPELRRLLWFLLAGKRGGENRARIIQSIRTRPSNLNQLSKELNLQYKAVQHHVNILARESLLIHTGEGYGVVYMLSPWFERHIETFERISARLGFSFVVSQGNATSTGLGTEEGLR